MSNSGAELVFITPPGMGHIRSNLELAKLIVQRNENISVLFLSLSTPSAKINYYLESRARDNPCPPRLKFTTTPPSHVPPSSSIIDSIELQKPLVKQVIMDRVGSGLLKPVGFVLNIFCTGMIDIANELHVPSYVFFTSGASFLNIIFYTLSLEDSGTDIVTEFSDPGFLAVVPGLNNPVTGKVIPGVFQDKNMCESFLNRVRRFKEMKGILVNTYIELESYAIQPLLTGDDKTIPPIYPVGPILDLADRTRGGFENEDESMTRWLDGQPKSSVVFLCFGSMGSFQGEQVREIAKGLERSGYRFLWALRKPPSEEKPRTPMDGKAFLECLPEGFLDRTAARGKIVAWAPQVEVLGHPAVGGFVSHCGWNSTLESLHFGVPIASWPLFAEQQLNAFELVKELEVAVEIKMDYKASRIDNFLVMAEEIEQGVRKFMSTINGKMKQSLMNMREKGMKALLEGGSSYNSLQHFIENVLSNVD